MYVYQYIFLFVFQRLYDALASKQPINATLIDAAFVNIGQMRQFKILALPKEEESLKRSAEPEECPAKKQKIDEETLDSFLA